MDNKTAPTPWSAARIMASTFGTLSGLGGIVHGIGEMLQGNVSTSGIIINSWTQGPIATNMGGEPAMTILPNVLAAGIAAFILSAAAIVWSIGFVHRKHGGLVLILLSIAMLLAGAGFAPPILGILAGAAGLGIHAHKWWGNRLPINFQQFLAKSWPWIYGICLINLVFLVVGSLVLVSLVGLNNPNLFVASFLFAIVSCLASIFTGAAYDVRKGYRVLTRSP